MRGTCKAVISEELSKQTDKTDSLWVRKWRNFGTDGNCFFGLGGILSQHLHLKSWLATQFPPLLSMLTAWIQLFYLHCEQNWPSSFLHTDLHRLAATGALLTSFKIKRKVILAWRLAKRPELRREGDYAKWRRKDFLICMPSPALSNLFLFKTKSKTCSFKPVRRIAMTKAIYLFQLSRESWISGFKKIYCIFLILWFLA